MPKPLRRSNDKNLIRKQLIALRKAQGLSQRDLAYKLQLAGYDVDKNLITRIETGKRYVTDIELKCLSKALCISLNELLSEN